MKKIQEHGNNFNIKQISKLLFRLLRLFITLCDIIN